MEVTEVDIKKEYEILTPEEVARFLKKSTSWIYKNWQELGGRKLGGSLFFPRKEELYEHIFHQRERMEVRLHPDR
jgi:predicted DNA-binding transcriptional regulator AlpA